MDDQLAITSAAFRVSSTDANFLFRQKERGDRKKPVRIGDAGDQDFSR
jgi:hypothetical protein